MSLPGIVLVLAVAWGIGFLLFESPTGPVK